MHEAHLFSYGVRRIYSRRRTKISSSPESPRAEGKEMLKWQGWGKNLICKYNTLYTQRVNVHTQRQGRKGIWEKSVRLKLQYIKLFSITLC